MTDESRWTSSSTTSSREAPIEVTHHKNSSHHYHHHHYPPHSPHHRVHTMSQLSHPNTHTHVQMQTLSPSKSFRLFPKQPKQPSTRSSSSCSVASNSSDVAIQSVAGSIANMTIASNDTANTVKVSNKRKKELQQQQQQHQQQQEAALKHGEQQQANKKTKTISWGSLKRFIGGKKEKVGEHDNNQTQQDDLNISKEEQHHLDAAILGRLDGMDVMSLGPANLSSHTTIPNILLDSFQPKLTPERMVQDLLWVSSGKVPAEMVLEGYLPKERWILVMDATRPHHVYDGRHSPIPSLACSDDDCGSIVTCDDGSLPIHLLLTSMWGPDSPPKSKRRGLNEALHDDILQLVAACPVPIDIDDDTFLIDNVQHLESVHEIASIPLRRGDYDSALHVFLKILRGFQGDGDKPHLLGSCWHNIGTVQLWQGKYSDALTSFEQAVVVRTEALPMNHPDISVSLCRYGLVQFAMGHLSDATSAFDRALAMHPKECITRAKILNNLGVLCYQSQDLVNALKHFTSALEIQRQWLDGPIRRDFIVFDTTVTLGNMGKCYLHQHDYETAFFVYEEALLLQSIAFRTDHEIVQVSLSNLGHVKAKQGEIKNSIAIYKGILKTQQAKYADLSKQGAETQAIIGQMYLERHHIEKALTYFSSVREWQKLNLHPHHPAVSYIEDIIKRNTEKLQGEVSVWI